MQTQYAFQLKNYIDQESLQQYAHHSILFVHFSSNSIRTVVGYKSQDTILGMRVLDIIEGTIFTKTQDELTGMFEALHVNASDYAAIKLIVGNTQHAFIPEALFSAEKAATLLSLNTAVTDQHKVLFNRLPKNKVSVFAIPESFYQSVKNIFPHADILHETELCVSMLQTIHQKENKDHVYVHIHPNYIEIAYLKNTHDLHYFNTFQVEGDTDIIYFILSVTELLKLNQDKLHVSLFGDIHQNDSLTGLMKKYITHVDFLTRPEIYSYPASFREFQDQQYYLQICSLFCAS